MRVHHLRLPVPEEEIEKLEAGDIVHVTGRIFTVRDRSHKRIEEFLERGEKIPFDLRSGAILHCGPIIRHKGGRNWEAVCIGATSSSRFSPFIPPLLKATFAAARHVTLAGHRAARLTSGRPRALITGGIALIVLGLVAVIQGSSLLGLTGIVFLLTGAYMAALGTWSLSLRILRFTAVIIVSAVVLLPGTPVVRRWLFGDGCGQPGCAGNGEAGHLLPWLRGSWHWPIFALLLVLLLLALSRQRARATSRLGGKPRHQSAPASAGDTQLDPPSQDSAGRRQPRWP